MERWRRIRRWFGRVAISVSINWVGSCTIGIGPDQAGKVAMNFGPLNRDGGWRRLNVLVTRARQRCVLFSSIHADQINLSTTRARGVAALKAYLQLAEQGADVAVIQPGDAQHVSIGETLSQKLRAHGYDVHANVGTVGSFVNLAVVDPDRPSRYLLGVESDGDVYASAPTARDRDRLRQQVLEDLGWQTHRVWSLDWYHRPEITLQRLLERLAAARRQPPPGSTTGATIKLDMGMLPNERSTAATQDQGEVTQRLDNDDPVRNSSLSHAIANYHASNLRSTTSVLPLASVSAPTLARVIAKLVEDESPIHEEEVQRVLAAYYNTRASKNARLLLEQAIYIAQSERLVHRRGDFLWSPTMAVAPVRRHGDDSPVSKVELIAPEELQETIKAVLAREFGLKEDALIVSTSRALGYRRCGASLEAAIRQAIQQLLKQEALVPDGEGFLKVRS
jgi:hypothetical protein